ncbi:MAG: hypothetical protein Tsb009_01210 [Planctomycetaceae bacterium]
MLTTYFLFNLENILRIAQPFVLGLAINGLLKGSYTGLIVFVVQHLAHLAVGTIRQMYDTRAFNAIYTDLASGLILDQRGQNVDVSAVAARSTLSRGYVEFFEQHVPMMIRAFYAIVGSLLLLGWYDWTLLPYCLALILPAMFLNAAYGKKSLSLSKRLHDQFELEVAVIGRGKPDEVRDHYESVAQSRVKLSDAEAINFGLMELFILGVLVASLLQFCRDATAQAGDIFAVFRYVMMFIMGLDSVPKLVHQVSRLKDIGGRMQSGKKRGRI